MRVWVTREEEDDGPLCTALRAAGLTPVLESVLTRRVLPEAHAAIRALSADDWLVLTSPFAIEAVEAEAARVPRVAVVGEPSRRAAQSRGLRVELVGDGDGASLFGKLRERARSGVVCYPRSSLVKPPQPWNGVRILSPVLYETTPRAYDPAILMLIDVIAVASASAVRAVGPVDKPFASIGAATSAALRQLGIEPWVEADTPGMEALAAAISRAAGRSNST